MPRATHVPADTDLLCENCGYVLNGLPEEGNCPECGRPVRETTHANRHPTAWEMARGVGSFLRTSIESLLSPTAFYRRLATRGYHRRSMEFETVHLLLASALLAPVLVQHLHFFLPPVRWTSPPIAWLPAVAVVAAVLRLVSRLAAWLTTWEATYRGLRVPRPVVEKAMHYHAPHYVVVAGVVLLTLLTCMAGGLSYVTYLYVLSGEVVIFSVYLFWTYWIAMRNVMYANK
jgi:hypothetical protein